MKEGFIIALDGPVASGKETLAPMIAAKLDGTYFDTGVYFRCVALACIAQNIPSDDEVLVEHVLKDLSIALDDSRVLLNGEDVTRRIGDVDVSVAASLVASHYIVQDGMIAFYRHLATIRIAQGRVIVAEGKNIATAMFPEAQVKIFLTASVIVRAQRRLEQWKQKNINNISVAEAEKDVQERDKRDQTRPSYPLTTQPEQYGYTVVDDTTMSVDETLEALLKIINAKRKK